MCPKILLLTGGVHPSKLDEEARKVFNGEGHRAWKLVFDVGGLIGRADHAPPRCFCGEKLVVVDEELH
jgi:hypothetical protein